MKKREWLAGCLVICAAGATVAQQSTTEGENGEWDVIGAARPVDGGYVAPTRPHRTLVNPGDRNEDEMVGGAMAADPQDPMGGFDLDHGIRQEKVVWSNGRPTYEVPSGLDRPILDEDLEDPAVIVWDNGNPNYVDGLEFTNFREAQDFTLSSGETISSVDFSAWDQSGGNFANFDGSFYWEILADNAGAPGGQIASGLFTNLTRTFDQTNGSGYSFYDWSGDLDNPVALAAGTYWLVFKMNTDCSVRQNYYWSQSAQNGSGLPYYDFGCAGSFTSYLPDYETSFTVYASDDLGGRYIDGNGGPDYQNGYNITGWNMAESFVVGARSTITDVDFSLLDTDADNLAEWSGSGRWEIWSDNGGAPGSSIASGAMVNPTATFDQNTGTWDFWDVSFNMGGNGVCLDPGTYWLSLHVNAGCTDVQLYWATSAAAAGLHGYDTGCADVWNTSLGDLSFTVYGYAECDGVYDGGGPDYANGYNITGWNMADSFTFSAQTEVTTVDFSLLDVDADGLAEWDGTGRWEVFEDNSGVPGASIASGSMVNPTATFDRNTGTWDFWDVTFSLGQSLCFDAGTYWLSLHVNAGCSDVQLYWSTSASGVGLHAYDLGCAGTWLTSAGELSFLLRGDVGNCGDCLTLTNSGYVGGQPVTWTVSGGTPGYKSVVVYGTNAGNINLNNYSASGRLWCATVGIAGVNPTKIVGNPKVLDGAGQASWTKTMPLNQVGRTILTQALGSDTCPDDCQSAVDATLVQ